LCSGRKANVGTPVDAISTAVKYRVGCLQGSPGVGKTFCVAAIVKAVIQRFGQDSIAVCAPTGKAAVRVAQSMQANGVDLPASTIHRLLQVEGEGGDGDGWSFHFNEQNPLPYRFMIIDEASMIDCICSPVSPGLHTIDARSVRRRHWPAGTSGTWSPILRSSAMRADRKADGDPPQLGPDCAGMC
jgi:hypothetical protein